jgi:uncharacterized protein (DUF433 family)
MCRHRRSLFDGADVSRTLVNRNPEIRSGTPCFAGTRVSVQTLFDYLEGTSTLDDFLDNFPSVAREVAVAVLELARAHILADAFAGSACTAAVTYRRRVLVKPCTDPERSAAR